MELNRLHPRALKFWRIQALLSVILAVLPATVAMGFLLGKALSASLGVALVVLVSSVAIWMAFWVPKLAYDRFGYVIREHDFYVERGVLLKRRTAIPLSRIQHVDTHQGPLEQVMKLSQLHVFTASGMSADGCLPGLSKEMADSLRDQLATLGNQFAQEDGV